MGSEGSSSPALRTYFVSVYFTGTPVNISELSGGCWGGERRGVTGCWDVGQRRHPVPRFVGTIRQLYHEAVLRNFETRHRELPGSVYVRAGSYTLREAAREDLPQVPYSECVKESVAKAR